jgi:hypothetical protein
MVYTCEVCKVTLKNRGTHDKSKRHIAKLTERDSDNGGDDELKTEGGFDWSDEGDENGIINCRCGVPVKKTSMGKHEQTVKHLQFENTTKDTKIRNYGKLVEEQDAYTDSVVMKLGISHKLNLLFENIFLALNGTFTEQQCSIIRLTVSKSKVKEHFETILCNLTPIPDVSSVITVVEVAVDEPVVEIAVDEPVVEIAVDEPVVEVAVDEPVAEVAVDEPVVEIAVDEPVVDEPVVDEPVVEEPVVEEPVVEEPVVDEPVVQINSDDEELIDKLSNELEQFLSAEDSESKDDNILFDCNVDSTTFSLDLQKSDAEELLF